MTVGSDFSAGRAVGNRDVAHCDPIHDVERLQVADDGGHSTHVHLETAAGVRELLIRFQAHKVSQVVDVERVNVALAQPAPDG